MRIRLLNRSGYSGMEDVKFPVEVEGKLLSNGVWQIKDDELARIGCNMALFGDGLWHFRPKSAEAV